MTVTLTSTVRRCIFWLALVAMLAGASALIQRTAFDASAAGEPYSVSLHSPVTFPIDI